MKLKDWIILALTIIGFEFMLFMLTTFGFCAIVNGALILFIVNLWCLVNQAEKRTEPKQKMNHNQFHKILVNCIEDIKVLSDPNWHWEIEQLEQHKYHVIGSHPVARRIDVIKMVIV